MPGFNVSTPSLSRNNIGKKKPSKSLALKGTHHYNNGIIQIQAKECPEGFNPGRLKFNFKN